VLTGRDLGRAALEVSVKALKALHGPAQCPPLHNLLSHCGPWGSESLRASTAEQFVLGAGDGDNEVKVPLAGTYQWTSLLCNT
jgi:hypothetical protein